MTPAETEHFAALRMHVAHLHNALVIASMAVEQRLGPDAVVAANGPAIGEVIGRALAMSELDCRGLTDLVVAARRVVSAPAAVQDNGDGDTLHEAILALEKALPA